MLYSRAASIVAVTACFQNIIEAYYVALNVGIGIGDAVSYPGLCREIDNH